MPNRSPHTLCIIGALHVDEIAIARAALIKGESNPVSWERYVGGVAANLARAAARFTTGVRLVVNIGHDRDGRELMHAMTTQEVQVINTAVSSTLTGRYSAVLDVTGEVFIGLADVAQAEHLTWASIEPHLDLDATECVIVDGNLSADTINQIVARCHSLTPPTHLLVAVLVSPGKAHRFRQALGTLDVLFCNRAEAGALYKTFDLKPTLSSKVITSELIAQGCAYLVMTDGQHGVHVVPNATLYSPQW